MVEGLSQEEQRRLVSLYPDLRFAIKLSKYPGVVASELTWSQEDMEILYFFTITLARLSLFGIGAVFICTKGQEDGKVYIRTTNKKIDCSSIAIHYGGFGVQEVAEFDMTRKDWEKLKE